MHLKNLKPQEIRILQANKIDRKTILLNYMDMYDQAVQAFDPNKEQNQCHPEQRKEYLVQRIGTQTFEEKQKMIDEDQRNTQRSLDQYSALNQSEETIGQQELPKPEDGKLKGQE